MSLLDLQGDVYLPLKANVIQTLNDLQFIAPDFATQSFQKMLNLEFAISLCKKRYAVFGAVHNTRVGRSWRTMEWNEFLVSLMCLN